MQSVFRYLCLDEQEAFGGQRKRFHEIYVAVSNRTLYTTQAKSHTTVDFLMNIIPNSVVDAFAKGDILQVLLFAILFGFALSMLGKKGRPLLIINY